MRPVWRRRWIRWHLTLGLVLAPYLVVYGLSAVLLNHSSWSRRVDVRWERSGLASTAGPAQRRAEALRDALGLFGAVPAARIAEPERPGEPLVFRIVRPGRVYDVRWFSGEGRAEVQERRGDWTDVLRTLHGLTSLPGSLLGPLWAFYTHLSLVGLPLLVLSGVLLDLPRWRRRPRVAWSVGLGSLGLVALMTWLTGP
ncbi:MAG: hypothetical protein QF410_14655 [Planctomycetota bacterium]|jgi:hypothetical protein|nr:hypothetical protein [Planctomycetota bacterium]